MGYKEENTEVVINGTGFPFGNEVEILIANNRMLEAKVLSPSTITAIVPAGLELGKHGISIKRSDGQKAILPDAFEVILGVPLTLDALTPGEIEQGDPAEISILGGGFDEQTQFSIGGVLLQEIMIINGDQAKGHLPGLLVAGNYDLEAQRGEHSARLKGALNVSRSSSKSSDSCALSRPSAPPLWLLLALPLLLNRRRRSL